MDNNENYYEPTKLSAGITPDNTAQRDVKAVNIVFLIMVVLPQIIAFFGLSKLIRGSYTMLLLVSQAVYILPVLVWLIFFKRSAEPCRFKKIRISNVLLCLVIYICIFPLLGLLNSISMLYSSNEISGVIGGLSEQIPYPLALVVVAILPAFCEELTYRGVFLSTYRKVNPLWAVILSGGLFGILHGNLNQITYAIVLGIVFALIVEATDSVFSSMIVHCMINAFSTTLVYLLPKLINSLKETFEEAQAAGDTRTMDMVREIMGSENNTMDSIMAQASGGLSTQAILGTVMVYLLPAGVGCFLAFMLLRFIARRNGRWEHLCGIFKNREKKGKVFTLALIAALVLLIGLIVLNELETRGIIQLG